MLRRFLFTERHELLLKQRTNERVKENHGIVVDNDNDRFNLYDDGVVGQMDKIFKRIKNIDRLEKFDKSVGPKKELRKKLV